MALGYLISPVIQVEDINGKPLVGGRIRVYRHGTQIPYITHKDWTGDLNPAEVRLDAKGMCILIAEDDNLYDVYCEDANYVEQWSRLNVAVGGGAGSGSGTVITSTDGSVTITRVGDTVDLSVADAVPSAIVTQSEARTANGPFIFTSEPINLTGDDIALVGSRIACKKRWYHYVATVKIDWLGTPKNSVAELTVSGPDCYDRVAFDLSFPHSEWLILAADYEVQHDGDTISFGISGMDLDGLNLEGMAAQITNVSVHTIVGRGQSSGGSDYEAGDGININENNVISVDWSRVQPKLTAGQNITIENNVISATGGGAAYTAGDAIDLTNDTINVKYGDGLGLSADNKLEVKLGDGLEIADDGGVKVISIDGDVSDVVATVEKLANDLDKKITTTYPFAQITTQGDFATFGVTNTSRMIGQLFAVPIASEIRKNETMVCVNALQDFSGNVSFGIFEYDFDGNNGTGSTYWIADTGTVSVRAGENEFPLKYVNNDAHEMQSSKLYYAVVAIAANAPSSGLFLASSPNYAATYNANPKYTLLASNMDNFIDWTSGTLSGAYFQGYNEDNTVPRLFMMLRNGEGSTPIPVTEPFTDIGAFTLQHQYRVSDVFSLTPDANGGVYRKVIPAQDVDITSFRYVDYHGSVMSQTSYPVLLDDTYTPMKSIGDGTWTLGDSDQTMIDGTHFVHEFTFTTPVHLTANTAYWFMVGGNLSNQASEWLITYQSPSVTNDLLLVKNMYNVNQWIIPTSGEFQSQQPGMYLELSDGTNAWTI